MKLFCLPYAGASAAIYFRWKKCLAPILECIPLELAGRGTRSGERFYEGMEEAREDVLRLLEARMDGAPYALFGHSMGGMILYETARLIRDRNLPAPVKLLFSGRPAPETPAPESPIHGLPDGEFTERILQMGATSEELFASKPLRDAFMPILRADFRLVETYEYEEKKPLPWEIAVITGEEEKWTTAEVEGWKRHTSAHCRVVNLPGGHFYWQDRPESLQALHTLLRDELLGSPLIESI
ncbi:thioesterase II family protein [Cohnella mopanensis]|uniref:thioesterase II family protein n=1 Tax=Cohnella mopanensis TaxID=2911966 RepID=UPI001EF77F18|nr:alpha/beta fold hydrolase [Cohnella mopanensis]